MLPTVTQLLWFYKITIILHWHLGVTFVIWAWMDLRPCAWAHMNERVCWSASKWQNNVFLQIIMWWVLWILYLRIWFRLQLIKLIDDKCHCCSCILNFWHLLYTLITLRHWYYIVSLKKSTCTLFCLFLI